MIHREAPKGLVYCKSCVNFDHISQDAEEKFCWVCAKISQQSTPIAWGSNITNGRCYMDLNSDNHCPFYSTEKISDEQLEKARIACSLRMSK
jgi:hypothetical protein